MNITRFSISRSLVTSIMLTGLLSTTGCVPVVMFGAGVATIDMATQERGVTGTMSDTGIRATINKLWFDKDIDLYRNVSLAVHSGRVLLMGYVETQDTQLEAVRLAWQAEGVREVINEIQVGPLPSIGSNLTDVWVSTKIRTLLVTADGVRSNNYSVTTISGVVYLLGIAQDPTEMSKVLDIAKDTRSVQRIVNHVILKSDLPMQAAGNTQTSPMPMREGTQSDNASFFPVNNSGDKAYTPPVQSSGISEEKLAPPA